MLDVPPHSDGQSDGDKIALQEVLNSADALMLLFDSSRPETFDELRTLEDRLLDLRTTADSVRTMIVGTNSDCGVQVSSDMLRSAEHQPVIVTSAALDRNVQTAFQVLLAPTARALRTRFQRDTMRRRAGASNRDAQSSTSAASTTRSSPKTMKRPGFFRKLSKQHV